MRVRLSRRRLLIPPIAVAWLLALAAAPALASTTTLNFETPVVPGTTSPAPGPAATTLYQSEGVTFTGPFLTPVGAAAPGHFSFPYLYRDTANAHSGKQVLYASYCGSEGCSFNDDFGAMFAQLSNEETGIQVYAGAVGGGTVELAAFSLSGALIAHQTESLGTSTKVDTHLVVSSSSADIAYFSVSHSGYGALEIDDLSLVAPAVEPAPVINQQQTGASGYQGSTAQMSVDIGRFNGADDPVDLAISGLPSGVTLTGGSTTIPAGSSTTTLTFTISSSAPTVEAVPFTVTATTADVSETVSTQDSFTVVGAPTPVTITVLPPGSYTPTSYASVGISPCASEDISVEVSTSPLVSTPVTLSLGVSGSSSGLYSALSTTTVAANEGGVTVVDLQLQRISSGDGGAVNNITITGTDGSYMPATATVQVDREGGLAAQGLYVTQGSQYDTGTLQPSGSGASGGSYQGVTLVAGKKTVVRFYADSDAQGVPGATALLYGYSSSGAALPGSPLAPDYGPGSYLSEYPGASTNGEKVTDAELESNSNAYTFTLPYSWTEGGAYGGYYPIGTNIRLMGEVLAMDGYGTESVSCQATDDFTLNNVEFTTVGLNFQAEITPVAMTLNGAYPAAPATVFADAAAAFPLPDGVLDIDQPYFGSVNISSIATETNGACGGSNINASNCASQKNSDVLGALEGYDDGDFNHAVGVATGVAYGETNGVPGQYSAVTYNTATYSGNRPVSSVAHELGHQFGLVHASNACGGGTNGQTGESWPPDQMGYLDGIGLNTSSEPYQFIANGVGGFTHAFDFMSYCAYQPNAKPPVNQIGGGDPNLWLSPRNWQQLVSNFGTGTGSAIDAIVPTGSISIPPIGRHPVPRVGAPLTADANVNPAMVSVLAFATSTPASLTAGAPASTAQLEIASVGPQVGAATKPGTAADSMKLIARGAHGRVLESVPMAATTGGHIEQGGSLVQLTGEVPVKGVDAIEISSDGTTVATRTRPRKAPTVTVISPAAGAKVGTTRMVDVSWHSTDPEHLRLTATIDYSRNAGRTWRTIFVGPDTGRARLESLWLTASQKAELRVRISDGFNEASANSGVFTAVGAPPEVVILSQYASGLRVSRLASLQLTGEAIDQAGYILSGRQLHWFDGPFSLGTGSSIGSGPLPAGVNHIRLVARDPAGRNATATLTITVARPVLPFLKLKIPTEASPTVHRIALRAGATIPATLTIGRLRFQLGQTRRITVPVKPGTTPVLLHLSLVAGNGVVTPFTALVRRSGPQPVRRTPPVVHH
jgi:hypothetical protein